MASEYEEKYTERILQDFGKEAFLTREKAEKALEAMKNE